MFAEEGLVADGPPGAQVISLWFEQDSLADSSPLDALVLLMHLL